MIIQHNRHSLNLFGQQVPFTKNEIFEIFIWDSLRSLTLLWKILLNNGRFWSSYYWRMCMSSNNIDIVLYTNRNIAFLDQSVAIIAAALHTPLRILELRINSSHRKWVRKYRPVRNRFDKFRFENHRLETQRPPWIVCCFSTATSIKKPSDIYRAWNNYCPDFHQ